MMGIMHGRICKMNFPRRCLLPNLIFLVFTKKPKFLYRYSLKPIPVFLSAPWWELSCVRSLVAVMQFLLQIII